MGNRLLDWFEGQHSKSAILDGTFAIDTESKFSELKSYRELITEGLRKDGFCYKYDISLPLSVYYHAVEVMRTRLEGADCTRICGYGHIGDCNLHFNVTSKQFDADILSRIEPFIYEFVSQHKGSISAEHGIGMKKRQFLSYSKSQEAIEVMRQLKGLLDPKSILNPHKVV